MVISLMKNSKYRDNILFNSWNRNGVSFIDWKIWELTTLSLIKHKIGNYIIGSPFTIFDLYKNENQIYPRIFPIDSLC